MSKSSPSPPAPPDPSQTAQAQTQSNLQTAIANARLNRVNQTTPFGSINYTQGAPDASGVPTYSANIQLSPQQQALLDQQQNMQLQRGGIANQLLDRVGSNLSQPLNLSGLHGINDRGSMYNGAMNAQPPSAQQAPVNDLSTMASPQDQLRNNPALRAAVIGNSGMSPQQQAMMGAMGGGAMGGSGLMGGGNQNPQLQQLMAAMQSLPPGLLQQLIAAISGGGGMQSPAPQAPQYSPGQVQPLLGGQRQ